MILAIDQGTTGTPFFVYDDSFEPIGRSYREFRQHFPQPGWVEHDLAELWAVTHAVAGEALADAGDVGPGRLHPGAALAAPGDVAPGAPAALATPNQRETVCVGPPATGEPLHRALVWQDRRT